jgi:NitT/TauT family transport system permease protein
MFDTAGTFAGIFTLLFVVMIINALLNIVEKHTLRWRPAGKYAGSAE